MTEDLIADMEAKLKQLDIEAKKLRRALGMVEEVESKSKSKSQRSDEGFERLLTAVRKVSKR